MGVMSDEEYLAAQAGWQAEIKDKMETIKSSKHNALLTANVEEELVKRRKEELRHAQDVREMYEHKLHRANTLYAELSQCLAQLEGREKELIFRENEFMNVLNKMQNYGNRKGNRRGQKMMRPVILNAGQRLMQGKCGPTDVHASCTNSNVLHLEHGRQPSPRAPLFTLQASGLSPPRPSFRPSTSVTSPDDGTLSHDSMDTATSPQDCPKIYQNSLNSNFTTFTSDDAILPQIYPPSRLTVGSAVQCGKLAYPVYHPDLDSNEHFSESPKFAKTEPTSTEGFENSESNNNYLTNSPRTVAEMSADSENNNQVSETREARDSPCDSKTLTNDSSYEDRDTLCCDMEMAPLDFSRSSSKRSSSGVSSMGGLNSHLSRDSLARVSGGSCGSSVRSGRFVHPSVRLDPSGPGGHKLLTTQVSAEPSLMIHYGFNDGHGDTGVAAMNDAYNLGPGDAAHFRSSSCSNFSANRQNNNYNINNKNSDLPGSRKPSIGGKPPGISPLAAVSVGDTARRSTASSCAVDGCTNCGASGCGSYSPRQFERRYSDYPRRGGAAALEGNFSRGSPASKSDRPYHQHKQQQYKQQHKHNRKAGTVGRRIGSPGRVVGEMSVGKQPSGQRSRGDSFGANFGANLAGNPVLDCGTGLSIRDTTSMMELDSPPSLLCESFGTSPSLYRVLATEQDVDCLSDCLCRHSPARWSDGKLTGGPKEYFDRFSSNRTRKRRGRSQNPRRAETQHNRAVQALGGSKERHKHSTSSPVHNNWLGSDEVCLGCRGTCSDPTCSFRNQYSNQAPPLPQSPLAIRKTEKSTTSGMKHSGSYQEALRDGSVDVKSSMSSSSSSKSSSRPRVGSPNIQRLQSRLVTSRDVHSDNEVHKAKRRSHEAQGSDNDPWSSSGDSEDEDDRGRVHKLSIPKNPPLGAANRSTNNFVSSSEEEQQQKQREQMQLKTGQGRVGQIGVGSPTKAPVQTRVDGAGGNGTYRYSRGPDPLMISSGSTMASSLERSLELAAIHSDGLSDKERKVRQVKHSILQGHKRTASNPMPAYPIPVVCETTTSGSESEEQAIV